MGWTLRNEPTLSPSINLINTHTHTLRRRHQHMRANFVHWLKDVFGHPEAVTSQKRPAPSHAWASHHGCLGINWCVRITSNFRVHLLVFYKNRWTWDIHRNNSLFDANQILKESFHFSHIQQLICVSPADGNEPDFFFFFNEIRWIAGWKQREHLLMLIDAKII